METQKEIFLSGEGNQWFLRNKETYENSNNQENIVVKTLKEIDLKPHCVLEVGCSNGSRLNDIQQAFGTKCYGIDPSASAIKDGKQRFPSLNLAVGTADNLQFEDHLFDTLIFGFCLYLCDRKDLFKIAAEADRCLADGGHLVFIDFFPPFPYKNKYTHKEGIYSYKMKYPTMFSWNPAYNEIYNIVTSHRGFMERNMPDKKLAISILNKNENFAYINEPYLD